MRRRHRTQFRTPSTPFARAFSAAFGVLWTILAIAITSGAPDDGPFVVAKIVFPLFGVLFVLMALFAPSPRLDVESETIELDPVERVRPSSKSSKGILDLKCPNCGAAASGEDVSPEGSAKCRACGSWFPAYK